MKKSTFYICVSDGNNGYTFQKVQGHIDEFTGMGFMKPEGSKTWTITDLKTGLKMTREFLPTLNAAKTMAEFILSSMEKIPSEEREAIEIRRAEIEKRLEDFKRIVEV